MSTISPKSTPPSRSRVGLSPPLLFPTPLDKVDFCEFFAMSWLPSLCDPLVVYTQTPASSSRPSEDPQSIYHLLLFAFVYSSAL